MNTPNDTVDPRRAERARAMELAALELFAERGFHNVPIEDIATAVGVHQRTILRYFRTKEDLLLGMPRRSGSRLRDQLRRRPSDEPPIEAMCQALLAAEEEAMEDSAIEVLWTQAANTHPAAFQLMVAEEMQQFSEVLTKRCEGSMPPNLAQALGGAIAGALHGLWQNWVDQGGGGNGTRYICDGLRLLESVTLSGQVALTEELQILREEVADLRVERELFKHAAASLLPPETKAS